LIKFNVAIDVRLFLLHYLHGLLGTWIFSTDFPYLLILSFFYLLI